MKVPSLTFAGGVLSQGLYGRVDLNKYQTGVKRAHNMNVAVEGGLDKRFGTYFVGFRKSVSQTSKFIPWRIADDDSYVLEFADNCVRFIRLGGYVSIPGGHVPDPDSEATNVNGIMEVPTPWDHTDVKELKYTFANDIMYIFHSTGIRQLKRLGLYDWSIETITFDPHPAAPTGLSAVWVNELLEDDNYVPAPQTYEYKVSATMADGTETKASAVEAVSADLGHQRLRVDLSWTARAGAIQYTVYKGKNGIFGFIGYTTGTTMQDRNLAPSYDIVPIGDPISMGGQNPRVGEFYKQRMAYGSTLSRPQDIWFSRPLIFNSLTKSIPLQDDDAFLMPLVGRERHTINHMVQLKKFLIFTTASEWVLDTVENSGLTAATANPVIETSYGSHPLLKPLAIGERVLFIQNRTGAVLDMGYEYTADSFKADDLTRLARDIFKGKEIVAWDYSIFPQNILYCVLDDGTLACMTYVREHEIWGWTTASTDGKFLDVACVSEGKEDGVYFQVERTINGVKNVFVERVEFGADDRIENSYYMDCSLGYIEEKPVTSVARLSDTELRVSVADHGYLDDDEIQLEIDGLILRGKVNSPTTNQFRLTPLWSSVWPEVIGNTGFAYECTSAITGLEHLEGAEVVVLADGKVYKQLTVAAGTLALPAKFARIQVGLAYSAEVVTLDLDVQQGAGLFNYKTVHEVILHLRKSRGVWAGPSKEGVALQKIPSRNNENMYLANDPLDGSYEVPCEVAWERNAGVRVRSEDPLPMNILNIVPDLIYGAS